MASKALLAMTAAMVLVGSGCLDRKKTTPDASPDVVTAGDAIVVQPDGVADGLTRTPDTNASRDTGTSGVDGTGGMAGLDGSRGSGGAGGAADVGPGYDTPLGGDGGVIGAGGIDGGGGVTIGTGGGAGGIVDSGAAPDGVPGADGSPGRDGPTGGKDGGVDVPVTCPASKKDCGGGVCVDLGGCCLPADCAVACQTCANNVCVAVLNAADPDSCRGICDAAGTCKSNRGQGCQTVVGGCVAGTMCSPDGICCNQACDGPCMACDLPTSLGTCAPVPSGMPHGSGKSCGTDPACGGSCSGRADGTCAYPTNACGSGPTCAAGVFIGQSTCSNGSCVTPTPTTCPSTGCNSLGTACNDACAAGTTACGTACCPAGQGCCNGVCTPLNTASNCGACGTACSSTQTCSGSSGCKNNDGQPCSLNTNCLSGQCKFFYFDLDHDSYPDQSSGGSFCSIAPNYNYIASRADDKWDCCDDAAAVNPANTAFTTTWADGVCPLHKWDGNCSGVIEYSFNPPECVSNGTGGCTMTTRAPTPSDCAVLFGGVCVVDGSGNCSVGFGMGGGTTLGCR